LESFPNDSNDSDYFDDSDDSNPPG
jgi:hypothetical protein